MGRNLMEILTAGTTGAVQRCLKAWSTTCCRLVGWRGRALCNCDRNSSTLQYIMPRLSTPNVFLLLSLLAAIATSSAHMTIPLSMHSPDNNTTTLVMAVEVNRFPYDIELTIESQPDYILDLKEMALQKKMVNRPDFTKTDESVFGVVEFQGSRRTDERVSDLEAFLLNSIYYVVDIFPRITWINLNQAKQILFKDRQNSAQGAINLGPSSSTTMLLNFKQYSEYMQSPLFTFKTSPANSSKGKVIFGSYPVEELKNPNQYTTTKLEYMGYKRWTLLTDGLQLTFSRSNGDREESLYKELIRMSLTFSNSMVVIPAQSGTLIERQLPGCNFQSLGGEENKNFFVCKTLDLSRVSNLKLTWSLSKAKDPITIRLSDLILKQNSTKVVFNLRVGKVEEYQIGSTLLLDYMLGFNYKEGTISYGIKGEEPWLDVRWALWVVLWINVGLFVVAVGVLAFSKRLRKEVVSELVEEVTFGNMPRKVNEYELASASEESARQ